MLLATLRWMARRQWFAAALLTGLLAGCLDTLGDKAEILYSDSGNYLLIESDLALQGLGAFNPDPNCAEPQVSVFSPAETNYDYSKAMINAQPAYDLGLTGRCVQVGVIDSGLASQPHPELPRDRVYAVDRYVDTLNGQVVDGVLIPWSDASHGTGVAGLIGAASDGVGMHGVAPGVNIRMLTLTFGPGSPNYEPITLAGLRGVDSDLTQILRAGLQLGSVINMSWSYAAPLVGLDRFGRQRYPAAEVRDALPQFIEVVAQRAVHESERKILVWSASNTGGLGYPADPSSPDLLGGLPTLIPELQGHWVASVAVDGDGFIADFSARCGVAKEFCIAAPGVCVKTTAAYAPNHPLPQGTVPCRYYSSEGSNYRGYDGTSFSAPITTGALALMLERFRGQLGNTAVVARLFATANKTGRYSNSDIYGQGLLDIGAAVNPVGNLSLALGGAQSRSLPALSRPMADRGGRLDALLQAVGATEVMLKDQLQAPFWVDFEHLPGARPLAAPVPRGQSPSLWALPAEGYGQQHLAIRQSASGRALPGYSRDWRGAGKAGSGVFASTGMPPSWLLQADIADLPLATGVFGTAQAFVAPWLALVTDRASGGGASVAVGAGQLSAALYRGEDSSWQLAQPDRGEAQNDLSAIQYQHFARRWQWNLQAGAVRESATWQGLATGGSVYGGFKGRTQYWGMGASWMPAASSWRLLASLHSGRTQVHRDGAGLLRSLSPLRDSHLQLGLAEQSLFGTGDSLLLHLSLSHRPGYDAQLRLPVALRRGETLWRDLAVRTAAVWERTAALSYRLPAFADWGLGVHFGRRWQKSSSGVGVARDQRLAMQAKLIF